MTHLISKPTAGRAGIALLLPVVLFLAMDVDAIQAISINDGWRYRDAEDSVNIAVRLPHCWNTDAYHTRSYRRGTGIYTRTITIPDNVSGTRFFLRLDGAATKSEIFVDSISAGSHIGTYSPHLAEITDMVVPGQTHHIEVVVDNADTTIPPYSADFTLMGGLYRDAWIVTTPAVGFDIAGSTPHGFKIVPHATGAGIWSIDLTAGLSNATSQDKSLLVHAELLSTTGQPIANRTTTVDIPRHSDLKQSLSINNITGVDLWSPESPQLYKVRMTLEDNGHILDVVEDYTAFRTFGFENNRFMLNGRPYKLRGMCRHQDQFPMGIALSDDQHRRDIELIKNLGANFVRISHYPQDDAILEMCDRLGLIVWEEIPVIDYVPDNASFDDNSELMLRQMIQSHYNHPSVAMWGYMNEILLRVPAEGRDNTIERTRHLAHRLENALKDEDPYRFSTMAFHGSDVYHHAGLGEITDVKGWNLYQGWYGGRLDEFEKFLSRQHAEHPTHNIFVSEYGAGSDLRVHSLNPQPFDFSMEYQQDYLEHYLPVIEDSTFVAGASHWNFIDFSSANRAESMPHINNKGLVTNSRRPKDIYHYFRAMWHDIQSDTVAHIAVRDWPERTEIFENDRPIVRTIKAYTNLPTVTLSVNGLEYGAATVTNCTARFDVVLTPGRNILQLLHNGRCIDATTIDIKAISSADSVINPGSATIAINAGSDAYFRSDDDGLDWLPCRQYRPGALYGHIGGIRKTDFNEVSLTDNQPLVQNYLAGLDSYRIDVVPGSYEIELIFAEQNSPTSASAYLLGRDATTSDNKSTCMDIYINGHLEEKDFSPSRQAGMRAFVKKRYISDVEPGEGLEIDFVAAPNFTTSLSAIKIRKLSN